MRYIGTIKPDKVHKSVEKLSCMKLAKIKQFGRKKDSVFQRVKAAI